MALLGVTPRRPEYPAALFGDQFLHVGFAVFGLGLEIAAEHGFCVCVEHRGVQGPLVPDGQRAVIGDKLGRQGAEKQHEERP